MFYIIKGLAVCWFVVLFCFWWFFPQKTKQIFSKKAATTKALKCSWPLLRYPRQTLIRTGKIIWRKAGEDTSSAKANRKGKTNTLPLLPQNAHVNSIAFTNKFALVMLTPLHVCSTWVTVNIYLCKYWRPVILIFVYANIYTGILVVRYHTSGTTSWQCSLPPRVTALAEKGQNQPKKYLTVGFECRSGQALQPIWLLWCWSWKIAQQEIWWYPWKSLSGMGNIELP